MTLDPKDSEKNIQLLTDLAHLAFPDNKILADLTVAQGILESNLTGVPSGLALKYNNLFGIKWPSTEKNRAYLQNLGARAVGLNTIEFTHTKINAFFIWFKTLKDCMDYRRYMMTWSIYKDVGESKTFNEAAHKISEKYATDSSYEKKLIQIYDKYVK